MNPNIALSFQRPKFDPAEGQRNALAMRQAQMQEAAGMMQMQSAQVAAERETARRNALAGVDWNAPDSLRQAAGVVAGVGDVDAMLAINNQLSTLSKEAREERAAELKALPNFSSFFQKPETWGQGLAYARQYAPSFAAGLPEAYDPTVASNIQQMSIGAQGWAEQQRAEERATFDREKFTYEQGQDKIANSLKADATAARREATGGAKISDEAGIRKEFVAGSKEFVTVRDAYQRVAKAGAKPTAAGDMAMIYNIMKMFDPNSVVRETEYATAQNAAGVPAQIQNTWNRLLSGERLAPAQRQDFIGTARGLMETQLANHAQYREEMRRIAAETGIEPSRVIVDYTKGITLEPQKEPPSGLPASKIGLVRNGYQFMGGDDTDPNNWRKISK